jgi:hypothetical protein
MHVTLKVIELLTVAAFCAPSVLMAQTPATAAGVVDQVNSAAKRRDFNALRRLMTDEFKWTLGPSSETADEAIAAWRRNRGSLQELVAATAQGCEVLERTLIQCPAGAGMGFRAGFSQVDGTWKMRYFLAGD